MKYLKTKKLTSFQKRNLLKPLTSKTCTIPCTQCSQNLCSLLFMKFGIRISNHSHFFQFVFLKFIHLFKTGSYSGILLYV